MSSKYYSLPLISGKIIELPSVNTCLPQPAYMRFSSNGTWVGAQSHAMIDRIVKGEIILLAEWAQTHPEVKQSVRAFVRWLQQVKFTPIASEVFVYSLEFGYAGTLDVLGKYRRRDSIGDFKTGDGADVLMTAIKLAAYSHAYFEMNSNLMPGTTWHITISKKTGIPTWIRYDRKDMEHYFQLFLEEKNKVIEWVGKIDKSEILNKEVVCQK